MTSPYYTRVPTRIYTSRRDGYDSMPALNEYNREKGLQSIEDVDVNDETLYCQNKIHQIMNDGRVPQMRNTTILKWWSPEEGDMNKRFIIIEITKGVINGIPDEFNGYILRLRRVG